MLQTPLRRSRRGQLALAPELTTKDTPSTETGIELHSRTTTTDDITRSQIDSLLSQKQDIANLKTHFYSSFGVGEAVKRPQRVYGRNKRTVKTIAQTYAIGDAVLVKTMSKHPSVAVIMAFWKVKDGDRELFANVSLHWFIRHVELPKVRSIRSYEPSEIYYTLSREDVMPLSSIVGHCTISPSKNNVPEDSDDHFFCTTALDPQRGIYYGSDWDAHRQDALKTQHFWETTQQWNIVALNPPDTPQKPVKTVKEKVSKRQNALSDVEEEDNEEETRAEPRTPSRRKRKNTSLSVSPSKRRRTVQHDVEEISEIALSEANEIKEEDTQLTQTPRKRRSKQATTTPKPGGRPKKKVVEDVTSEGDGDDDRHSDYQDAPRSSGTEEVEEDEVEEEFEPWPKTPSRRGRRSATSTPRKQRTTLAAPTPHSKAALRARASRKRKLAVRPPAPDRLQDLDLQLQKLSNDPWLRAMHVLHVSARPEASGLPCREEEYARVLRSVEELLEEGSGGCIYISGVPGTGKTATVHAVVRELKRMAEQNETSPFSYVEINGLRIPEPAAAYGLLWEAVSGHDAPREGHLKISAKEALKQLTKHFSQGDRIGPGGHACVVLMDELDQLMTTKQDVVYNFFNWPTLVGSKLVVLAVANTMDLPERVMTGRVRSRLGMVRINFQPYTTPQLEKIVQSRLAKAKEGLSPKTPDVIAPDGIKFAAMKVSSISGDARRVLDMCRRAVELVQPQTRTARTDDVKRVIQDMQNSPTAAYIRELSFHERLMLAALLRCVRKEGVEEIKWGDLQRQHLLYMNLLAEEEDPTRRPTSGEMGVVLDNLGASRAILCEEGALVARKPEDEKRVVLNLEHIEVERVLGEIGGTKWKNALNI